MNCMKWFKAGKLNKGTIISKQKLYINTYSIVFVKRIAVKVFSRMKIYLRKLVAVGGSKHNSWHFILTCVAICQYWVDPMLQDSYNNIEYLMVLTIKLENFREFITTGCLLVQFERMRFLLCCLYFLNLFVHSV